MRYQDFARKDLDGALTKWEEHLDRTGSRMAAAGQHALCTTGICWRLKDACRS